jgi:hypothetical protein
MHTKFWLENLEGCDHLEDLDIDQEIMEVVDWIHLAQDRNQWWAVVNMVMNLWVP